MNRLSLFLKITAVIFLTFFLGNSNVIAQATVCPTTSSYTYNDYYGPSDAVDFVVANPTDLISMDFTSGSTESCCDEWIITDGAGGTGNVIASGYGAISTTTTYTSTTGTISFYVDADGSVQGSTFNFSVTCSSPATCAAPTTPIVSGITESTVDYTFTDNASATQWQIAWGTTGFDPTTATLDATNSSIETSTNTGISGLTSETDYVVYVRAICGAGDTSDWSSAESFTTAIACPAGAICASYTGGQTSTDYSFSSSTGSSCPSSVSVTVPSGYQLDSVSINYEMVAQGGGWKSEQRSFLGCSSLGAREVSTYSGSGNSGGAQSYSRSGLTFAQGGTGTLDFELHAGRTYGGSGCGTSYNYVSNGWFLTAYYSVLPSCLDITDLTVSATSSTSSDISFTDPNTGSTGYIVSYSDGSTTNTVSPNPTGTSVSLTGLTANTSYTVSVQALCASGDTSSVVSASLTTPCDAFSVPLSEDFEGSTSIPSCWSVINGGSSDAWSIYNFSSYAQSGTNSARLYTDGNSGNNDDYLITPPITLTGNQELTYSYRVRSSSEPNDFRVLLSTTGNSASDFTTTLVPSASYSNTSYATNTVNLSAYSGDVYIAFFVANGGLDGWYLYFDDISVTDIPTCLASSNLQASNVTSSTAILSWLDNNTSAPDSFQISYGPSGTSAGSGLIAYTTDTFIDLSGLTSARDYVAYVRAICSDGDTSAWTTAASFTTLCDVYSLSYSEDFTTFMPTCWTEYGSGTPSTGPTGSEGSGDWTSDGFMNSGYSGSARIQLYNYYYYANDDWLISPEIDLGSTTARVTFDYGVTDNYYSSATSIPPGDEVILLITDDGGTSWDTLVIYDDATTVGASGNSESIILTGYSGTVQFAFYANATAYSYSYNENFYVDNFVVEEAPTCFEPSNVLVSNVTASSADLSWTDNNTPASTLFEVNVVASGGAAGTGTSTYVNVTSESLTGLSSETAYDVYVRANCGSANSPWSSVASFTTDPSCFAVTGLSAASTGTTSADVSFTDPNSASEYFVTYSDGVTTDTVSPNPTSTSFSLSGLSASTSYTVSVQAICGVGDSSSANTTSFATPASGCGVSGTYTYNDYYGPSDAVDYAVDNAGDWISLDFSAGSTESCCDDWYITDGAGGTGNIIASGSGSISTSTTYTSTTGTISFYVDADGSVQGSTFEYIVTCSTPPSCLPLTSVSATATSSSTIDVAITDPNSATEYFVTYTDGVTTDTVSPNPTSTAVTLTGLTSNTSYTVSVRAICGAADSSDVSSASATTPCAVYSISYSEDFSTFMPTCWTEYSNGTPSTGPTGSEGSGSWTSDGFMNSGSSGSARVRLYDYYGYGTDDWLVSPEIDLGSSNARVAFDYGVTTLNGSSASSITSGDEVILLITDDGGTSWDTLAIYNDATTVGANGNAESITLTGYSGTVQFAFYANSTAYSYGTNSNFYVDNFLVEEIPSCFAVTVLSATATSSSSADVSFTDPNSASEYFVTYTDGVTTDTVSPNPTSTSFSLSGLSASTSYTVSVQALCGVGDSSSANTTSFATPASGCGVSGTYTYNDNYGPSDAVDYAVDNAGDWISLDFSAGSTESCCDDWYITDGAGGTGNIIASGSGSISTSTTYTSTTGTISFYVDADGSVQGSTFEYIVTCSTPPSCLPLTSVTATATSSSSIDVSFTDPNSASEYFVTYSDGVTTDTVSPNPTSTAVTLTGLTSNTSYTVSVRAICGAADSSDVSSASATTPCAVYSLSYSEDFSTFMPTCWTEYSNGTPSTGPTGSEGLGDWTSDGFMNSGYSGSARIQLYNYYYYANDDWLISPEIDLGTTTAEVKFDYGVTSNSGTSTTSIPPGDEVILLITDDGGTSWDTLAIYNDATTVGANGNAESITLTGYSGTVQFAFYANATAYSYSYDENFYVDNFLVRVPPSCADLSGLSATSTGSSSADVTFTDPNSASEYFVTYTDGVTTDTVSPNPTSTSFSLSGLSAATSYTISVQALCGAGDSSMVASTSVTTDCGVYSLSYSEDFTTFMPTCWTEYGSGTPSTGPTGSEGSGDWTSDGFMNSGYSGSARIQLYNYYYYANDDWLISPEIDLGSSTARVNFDYGVTSQYGSSTTAIPPGDEVILLITDDGGTSWDTLAIYNDATTVGASGNSESIILTGYSGTVQFAFYANATAYSSSYNENFYVDNFVVEEAPTCFEIDNITFSNATSNSVDYSITDAQATAIEWVIYYSDGSTTDSATVYSKNGTITGLSGNTTYTVYVEAVCDGPVSSPNSSNYTFTTDCDVQAVPYATNFSSFLPDACWDEAGSGNIASGPSAIGSSDWRSSGGEARVNIHSNTDEEWLITPYFDLGTSGYQVEFDFDVFAYNTGTNATCGSDDSFDLLITADSGATWVSLFNADNTYAPASSGNRQIIDVSSYSGIVQFAFFATDGSVDDPQDVDFVVDNFAINPFVTCNAPVGLAIGAGYPTSDEATLVFTDVNTTPSGDYIVEYGLAGYRSVQAYDFDVTATSMMDYTISGSDRNGSVSGDDPSITAYVGDTMRFDINSGPTHPFVISSVGTLPSSPVAGVINNGAVSDTVTWIPASAGTYYYICDAHPDMVGTITVIDDSPQTVSGTTSPILISGLTELTSYDAYVRSACSVSDSSAWAGPITFTMLRTPPATAQGVNCGGASSQVIFSEDFESTLSGWTGDLNAGNGSWESPSGSTSPSTGPNVGYGGGDFMNYEASAIVSDTGTVISPMIDLSSASTSAELSFWMHAYGSTIGTFTVGVGTSASGPFTTEFTWTGELQPTAESEWANVGVDLTSYLGDTIYLAFTQTDGAAYYGDLSIDEITVTSCVACASPTSLVAAATGGSTVDVSFTDPNTGSTGYIVTYSDGSTTDTVNPNPTSTSFSISGLTELTTYTIFVQSLCSTGDTSISATTSVTTERSCPSGAVCATYSGGDSPTDYSFSSSTGSSCPSSVSVTVPSGFQLDSVSIEYEMVAQGGGWKSEQRSFLGCSSLGAREVSTYSGSGNSGGAQSYSRSGLTFAQGGTGTLDFELHAGRTYGGSGCGTSYNYVSNGWFLTAYYSVLPSCLDITDLTASATSSSTIDVVITDPNNASEYFVTYSDGVTTDTVSPNPTDTAVTLSGLNANTSYTISAQALCGAGDSSSVASATVTTSCNAFSVPFSEDFEGSNSIPSCWSVINGGSSDAWSIYNFSSYAQSGTNSARLYTDGNYGNNDDYLITPPITLTGNQELTYSYRVRSSSEPNDFSVLISTTGNSASDFTTTLVPSASYSNTSYATNTVNLSAYSGDVYIAFYVANGGLDGWYLYFDDISVTEIPTCLDLTGITATSTGSSSADVSFTDPNSASEYFVTYSDGVTTDTVSPNPTSTSVSLSGLSANTTYTVSVQALCGAGDSSAVASTSVTTDCGSFSIPWSEGFESLTSTGTTIYPSCWSKESGTWRSSSNTYYASPIGNYYIAARYGSSSDYMWTPGFDLTAGTSYDFIFNWAGDGYSGWTGDVFVHTAQNSSSGTPVQLGSSFVTSSTSTSSSWTEVTESFTPSSSGVYYFAIRIDDNYSPYYIHFDDFSVVETPSSDYTWSGGTSSDWGLDANWSNGTAPSASTDVVIVPSATNEPSISGSQVVGNLTVEDNVTVTLGSGASLEVNGDASLGSGSSLTGDGTVSLSGGNSGTDLSITGSATIENLVVASNYSLSSGILNITGGLTLDGGDFTGGINVVLTSDANGTSYLDDFSGAGGAYNGQITTQLYIPGTTGIQHLISSPINNVGLSELSDDLSGYGAGLTGTDGVAVTPATPCDPNALDPSSNYGNMFEYDAPTAAASPCQDQGGWIVRSAGNMEDGRGYSAYLTGAGATLDMSGTPNTGNISFSMNAVTTFTGVGAPYNGWDMLGNPYPSSLDRDALIALNQVAGLGSLSSISYWNPSGTYSGTYQAYQPGDVIASFQGFAANWSTSTSAQSATINFTNDMRTTADATWRSAWYNERIDVELRGNGFADRTTIAFADDATNGFDALYDAEKFASAPGQPTLYTGSAKHYALNSLAADAYGQSIPMGVMAGADGYFEFDFSSVENLPTGSMLYLEDLATGTWTNVSDNPVYGFDMLATDASDRFILHFTPSVTATGVDGTCEDGNGYIELTFDGFQLAGQDMAWNYAVTKEGMAQAQGSMVSTIAIPVSESGIYNVDFTLGSSTVNEVLSLEVPVAPTAAIPAEVALSENEAITLNGMFTNANSYEWTVDGVVFSTEANPTWMATAEGIYDIAVTVRSEDGCSASDNMVAEVSKSVTSINDVDAVFQITQDAHSVTVMTEAEGMIEMIAMDGKLVASARASQGANVLSTQALAAGLYEVRLSTTNGVVGSQKVLVK